MNSPTPKIKKDPKGEKCPPKINKPTPTAVPDESCQIPHDAEAARPDAIDPCDDGRAAE